MTTKISSTNHANGISGYDFSARCHFETLNLGCRGIAVRINQVKGNRRYMVVTGTTNHHSAYEIAKTNAPIEQE